MEIKYLTDRIIEVVSDGIVISEPSDAMDLMGSLYGRGTDGIVIAAYSIAPAFFDLKTGLAGEILQKFTTYGFRLAIVGDFGNVESKSLRDFIRESNRVGRILFVESIQEAVDRWE